MIQIKKKKRVPRIEIVQLERTYLGLKKKERSLIVSLMFPIL